MRIGVYIVRRLLYVIPQILGISLVTFVVVRLLPTNPAYALAGPSASAQTIRTIEKNLGLDKPIWVQYVKYMGDLVHGNLGTSFLSGRPVLSEIGQYLPATLELLLLGLFIAFLVGIPLGVLSALAQRRRIASRFSVGYGLLAGAIPDFWFGLILIYIFYYILKVAPAPLGQIATSVAAPPHVTGMIAFDALFTGSWSAFQSAVGHLVLPLVTVVFVYMAPVVKFTRSSIEGIFARGGFVDQYRANGLSHRAIVIRALRSGLPPVVTIGGVLFGYLLGGLVLIETVFSWGGFGQYAVQAITNGDFPAIEGVVIVAAIFNLLVYLIVDLLYFAIDPRLRQAL